MHRVFHGSESVAAGEVTKYQLRAHYQRIFPDVYACAGGPLSVEDRALAAFLWSRRRAVVTDVAASALVPEVLALVDAGAQSPKETWLRLLLIEAGFPRPRTQIPVLSPTGRPRYYLDMGWEEVMIAVEYDGEHHRTDRDTYTNDITRSDYVHDLGWRLIRVVAGNRRSEIVEKTRRAWSLRQNSILAPGVGKAIPSTG